MDADAGEEEAEPAAGVEDLLEVFDISDDGTGVVKEGDDDDRVEVVGSDVDPGAGDESNDEAGGGAGGGSASHQLLT